MYLWVFLTKVSGSFTVQSLLHAFIKIHKLMWRMRTEDLIAQGMTAYVWIVHVQNCLCICMWYFLGGQNRNCGENLVKKMKYLLLFCCCCVVLISQSCPNLCDPMGCSLSGSSVHGILEAGILEWVAIPFSRGSSQARNRTQVSCIIDRYFTIWALREALLLF